MDVWIVSQALHYSRLKGIVPQELVTDAEIDTLEKWWNRACNVVNYGTKDIFNVEKANTIIDLCISFARQILLFNNPEGGVFHELTLEGTKKNFFGEIDSSKKLPY